MSAPSSEDECKGAGGAPATADAATSTASNAAATAQADAPYFDSYSHFGIHEEMLKDAVRTDAYRDAILKNAHLFAGKTVLDVGCGTGILCMFAAQAGASHVYGIDCASIADQARKIVAANGFADRITIIQNKVEDVTLPVEQVDIIVSEWMGYCLLYESMLDTVLFARDKWLAPGGLLMPDRAAMAVCAIEDAEFKAEKFGFWENVYGFDMRTIRDKAMLEPVIDAVGADAVISNHAEFFTVDLAKATPADLEFCREFEITFTKQQHCHAVVLHFSVDFSASHAPVRIDTSPEEAATHWKHTVLYLDKSLAVHAGEKLTGAIRLTRHAANHRHLSIVVSYAFNGKIGGAQAWSQLYNVQ